MAISGFPSDSIFKKFPAICEETRKISVALSAQEAGSSLRTGFLPYAFACHTLIEKSASLRKAHQELDAALQELSGRVQMAYSKISPSEFINAIQLNDVRTVEKILTISDLQNKKLSNGEMPLHYAIRCGSEDVVRYLLESAQMNPLALDHQGLSAFDHAILGNDQKMIALVMSAALGKAIPESALSEEVNPLEIQSFYPEIQKLRYPPLALLPAFHSAAFLGDIPSLEKLTKETDINASDSTGMTALHYAVLNGREDVVKWLIKKNAKIDGRAANGMNLLHTAVVNGSENILKLLLEKGKLDLNAADGRGRTPLHFALAFDRLTFAKVLIERGADPLIQTMEMTPIGILHSTSKLRALHKDPLKMDLSSVLTLASFVSAAACRYFGQYEAATVLGAFPIFGQLLNVSFISKSHPLLNLGARIAILPALHGFINDDRTGKMIVQGTQTAWLGKKWFDNLHACWNNGAVETYRPLRNALIHTANALLSGVELLRASEVMPIPEQVRILMGGKKLENEKCLNDSARSRSECKRAAELTLGLGGSEKQACKKAYHSLSVKYHPDKQGGRSEKQTAINTAYDVLDSCKIYS